MRFKTAFYLRNILSPVPNRKLIFWLGALLVFVSLVFVGVKVTGNSNSSSRIEVKGAKKTAKLAREFTYALKDDSGEEVSRIKFELMDAELRDEIIVKGQRATAVRGRVFMIINLKITNGHNQSIEMNTKDYLRLSVNGNTNEWLAPDIHNDPVQIQAISTKYTRVGFPINDTDKNLILRVGEIDGQKEDIQVKF